MSTPPRIVVEAEYLRTPGKAYTFYCDLLVEVGDYVIVDSQNGPGIAKIAAVHPYKSPKSFGFSPRFVITVMNDFAAEAKLAHTNYLKVCQERLS